MLLLPTLISTANMTVLSSQWRYLLTFITDKRGKTDRSVRVGTTHSLRTPCCSRGRWALTQPPPSPASWCPHCVLACGRQPTRDSPGEDAGVGHHALLQGIVPTWRSNLSLLASCIGRWVLCLCAPGKLRMYVYVYLCVCVCVCVYTCVYISVCIYMYTCTHIN